MRKLGVEPRPAYRVWLVGYEEWEPRVWNECPPRGVVLEPAEEGWLRADEAAVFLHSFNTAMLRHPKRIWAVPVRVVVRYEGDLSSGDPLEIDSVDFSQMRLSKDRLAELGLR